MSVNYKSIIGLGYIIPKEKVEELRLLPNFEDIEDNLQALNGWDENSNYFFGKIINDCEPGNFVLDCDIPIWYYDEVETEYGRYLCDPGDFCTPDRMLITLIE